MSQIIRTFTGRVGPPGIPLPVDMSDGVPNPVTFRPWDGGIELAVDRAIGDARGTVYPLHGLDAHDPRD